MKLLLSYSAVIKTLTSKTAPNFVFCAGLHERASQAAAFLITGRLALFSKTCHVFVKLVFAILRRGSPAAFTCTKQHSIESCQRATLCQKIEPKTPHQEPVYHGGGTPGKRKSHPIL